MRLPSQPYLCHLHSNTFGEIPLDVLQVNLCCAACNVTQLQSKTFWSIFKQMKTETKRATVRLSWFKRYLITQRTQPPPLDPHLNTSVVGPHLILDPVFFKDVNWLQKCEPLYVPFRFIPGRVENHKKKQKTVRAGTQGERHTVKSVKLDSHVVDFEAEPVRCRGDKKLVTVQHGPVVTFNQQGNLLKQRVRLICDSYLQETNKCHTAHLFPILKKLKQNLLVAHWRMSSWKQCWCVEGWTRPAITTHYIQDKAQVILFIFIKLWLHINCSYFNPRILWVFN